MRLPGSRVKGFLFLKGQALAIWGGQHTQLIHLVHPAIVEGIIELGGLIYFGRAMKGGPDGSKERIISIDRAPRRLHSTAYVQNV